MLIQNFRPGVMERIGLDYEAVRELNPRLVYATVTGYGSDGPWRDKPGQDLLAQSLSGLAWLSGNADQGPVPIGLAVADILAGAHLVQGILACLVRRGITGARRAGRGQPAGIGARPPVRGADHLSQRWRPAAAAQRGQQRPRLPRRALRHLATADGYLALAMGSVPRLGELLAATPLLAYADPQTWFTQRDEIKALLAEHLRRSRPPTGWPSWSRPTTGAPMC